MSEEQAVFEVRALRAGDLDDIVRIDEHQFGVARPEYYKVKLKNALEDTSVRVSLAAEHDGVMVGFLMASIYYGDYGRPESTASVEVINVHPDFARRGVGTALWRQLARNLKAMRIEHVETVVSWDDLGLLEFLRRVGFGPAERLCVQCNLDFESDD